jgi:hypothetical protein
MSRTIYTDLSRTILVAGIFAGAGLVRPGGAAAQTVSPEQALLNRAAVGSRFPTGFGRVSGAPADPPVTAQVSGEQALLGRTAPGSWTLELEPAAVPSWARRAPMDGEAALLGRRDRIEATSR